MGGGFADNRNSIVGICDEVINNEVMQGNLYEVSPGVYVLTFKGRQDIARRLQIRPASGVSMVNLDSTSAGCAFTGGVASPRTTEDPTTPQE